MANPQGMDDLLPSNVNVDLQVSSREYRTSRPRKKQTLAQSRSTLQASINSVNQATIEKSNSTSSQPKLLQNSGISVIQNAQKVYGATHSTSTILTRAPDERARTLGSAERVEPYRNNKIQENKNLDHDAILLRNRVSKLKLIETKMLKKIDRTR